MYPNLNKDHVKDPEMFLIYLLSSEGEPARIVAKYCHDAFDARTYAAEFMPKSPKVTITKSGRTVKPRDILDL